MTPIRSEEQGKYPDDWKEISHRIRFERAGGKCECTGQCGTWHSMVPGKTRGDVPGIRCNAGHRERTSDGSEVVLTTMHLDHDPSNCEDENLLAGCQFCHNLYDADHRREGIKARAREVMESGGQGILFN